VHDWDRVGLDGKPRALHIQESLASIDFNDFEPAVLHSRFSGAGPF
jgi:mannose-6-phosphate isomerase